jgi:hypothetical protein
MSEQVSVSRETKSTSVQYAKERGCTPGEAIDRLVMIAVNRLNALAKYADRQAPKKPAKKEPKAKAKKAAKKAAKKPAKKTDPVAETAATETTA